MKTKTLTFGHFAIITVGAIALLLGARLPANAQSSEIEVNDSLASATPLVFANGNFSAVVVGSASAGDMDYYSFVSPIPAPFGTVKLWAFVDTGGGSVTGPVRNSLLTVLDESGIEEATDDNDGTRVRHSRAGQCE